MNQLVGFFWVYCTVVSTLLFDNDVDSRFVVAVAVFVSLQIHLYLIHLKVLKGILLYRFHQLLISKRVFFSYYPVTIYSMMLLRMLQLLEIITI